ncbi:uncharacterized protein LOC134272568 [Saccostrea cucullata]|uniref:uncharacterized protein LOC134272568 n=1 Tax=Saccostrea cuccullata TaxID=36930 RepID=UPI002ED28870
MASGFRESQELWEEQAFYEAQKNHESRYHHGRGPCNIFILDTSSSLGEEGFQEMKETFGAIIDGYANCPNIDENVAVIICGRSTKFQRYYSNHYSDIKHCLDAVEFGGLTPLIAAFTLAKVCLFSEVDSLIGHTKRIGDFHVHPRIILISDGRPTDFTVISDVEDSPAYETEEVQSSTQDKKRMLDFSKSIGRLHPIFCIPVGSNPDLVFLFLCSVIGHICVYVEWDTGSVCPYAYRSKTYMKNIHVCRYDVTVCSEPRITKNGKIATGCLVKRGPDWEDGDKDVGVRSIGSVYRCKRNRIVHVRWHNGQKTENRFGYRGKYDLQICDPFSPEAVEYLQDQTRKAELNFSVKDSLVDISESSSSKETCASANNANSKMCQNPSARLPLLTMPKGKYFKNDKCEDKSTDVEADGMLNSLTFSTSDQWLWKDKQGQWNPYPRKINDKINRCYKRNPNSTVIVTIEENTYRVVMAKGIQINLTTREESEVKIVTD